MSYIGNQPLNTAFLTDTFTGNGSTTAFTMSVAPANPASVLVAVSGVLQAPSTYSVNATTLTFSAAPPSGTANISVRYLGVPASGVTTTAYSTRTEFTATAGQTTFTTSSYTVGFIQVYRNGVLLGTTDYTATSGTTVVLAVGATAGDLVTTISFYVSSVLNAIPATAGAVTNAYLGAISTFTTPTSKTVTLPDVTGTVMVSGNMPAFSANLVSQSLSSSTVTKITFTNKNYDTNNNFSSSRFTPTVAGYYLFVTTMSLSYSATSEALIYFYKNGSYFQTGQDLGGSGAYYSLNGSAIAYMNGSTDYMEIYGYTGNSGALSTNTIFSGCLLRSA